jgi:MSHA pilin protein MshA
MMMFAVETNKRRREEMRANTRNRSGEAGFTLVEIIAVLVILAVLAAVAIPRYIGLIDDARDQALQGAISAGMSHVSLSYGRLALQNGTEPTAAEIVTDVTANPPSGTDYTFTFAATTTPGVNVTAVDATDSTITDTKEWIMP